ncbi:MAG: hypothetical protein Q6370_020330, partial [Candidatus Sigynarchaeota archaeon]
CHRRRPGRAPRSIFASNHRHVSIFTSLDAWIRAARAKPRRSARRRPCARIGGFLPSSVRFLHGGLDCKTATLLASGAVPAAPQGLKARAASPMTWRKKKGVSNGGHLIVQEHLRRLAAAQR